jgi:nicotinic acid mononucleotide adenylyltransferase
VSSRDDIDKIDLDTHIDYLKNKYKNVKIYILNMNKIKVSSTELRKTYRDYKNISNDIMDDKVNKYIKENRVYE